MSPKVGMGPVRREQIVRATVRCLARDGYTRLTMKKVARGGGGEPGHPALLLRRQARDPLATLETVSRDLDRRVAAAQSRTGRDPAARLRALVRACLDVAVRQPEVWSSSSSSARDVARPAAARGERRGLRAYPPADRPARQRGRATGRFRAVDPRRAAAVVLGLVDGLSLQLTFDPEAFSIAAAARSATMPSPATSRRRLHDARPTPRRAPASTSAAPPR